VISLRHEDLLRGREQLPAPGGLRQPVPCVAGRRGCCHLCLQL